MFKIVTSLLLIMSLILMSFKKKIKDYITIKYNENIIFQHFNENCEVQLIRTD